MEVNEEELEEQRVPNTQLWSLHFHTLTKNSFKGRLISCND